MAAGFSKIIEAYQEADNKYTPELHKKIEALLLENTKLEDRPPRYSGLVRTALNSIVYDFKHFSQLESGETFRKAVKNLRTLLREEKKREAEHFSDNLCDNLKEALYGRYQNIPFPVLLTCLLDLKILRSETYKNSLNAAKWTTLIAWAVESYNVKNRIHIEFNPRQLFIPALIKDYGMLHPYMPDLESSSEKISDKEREILNEHGQLGLEMLLENGMPKSEHIISIVGSHSTPIDIESGIAAVADAFEGMFFSRAYRKEKMHPTEIFRILGLSLFGKKALEKIEAYTQRYGYRYTFEQALKNSLLPPYQMLRWLLE